MFERLLTFDHELSTRLTAHSLGGQVGVLRIALQLIAHSGDSLVWIGIGIGLWALNQTRWALRNEITVFVLIGVIAVLKFIFRRRRPTGQRGKLYLELDAHSFPSGHAARTAALAITFGTLDPLFGLGLAIWAALVSIARVALGIHYVSDVVVGAAVGIGAGAILATVM